MSEVSIHSVGSLKIKRVGFDGPLKICILHIDHGNYNCHSNCLTICFPQKQECRSL